MVSFVFRPFVCSDSVILYGQSNCYSRPEMQMMRFSTYMINYMSFTFLLKKPRNFSHWRKIFLIFNEEYCKNYLFILISIDIYNGYFINKQINLNINDRSSHIYPAPYVSEGHWTFIRP
jgi:hypothetical protein